MDKYLVENSAYNRLWVEYNKYNSLIVCVDFDDTLFDFYGTGESYEMVRQLVRDLHSINCYIIIWTGNQNTELVKDFLSENNIPYHSINDEAPVSKKLLGDKIPRKVYGNVYIDDRGGLHEVYNTLTKLVNNVNKKSFYRVCHESTEQGLWYASNGVFTGLIHNKFDFCENSELKMDFDIELVGWLSAVESLEVLYTWFTKEDIIKLQEHGWYIHEYKTDNVRFYEKFQHFVIDQNLSVISKKIILK